MNFNHKNNKAKKEVDNLFVKIIALVILGFSVWVDSPISIFVFFIGIIILFLRIGLDEKNIKMETTTLKRKNNKEFTYKSLEIDLGCIIESWSLIPIFALFIARENKKSVSISFNVSFLCFYLDIGKNLDLIYNSKPNYEVSIFKFYWVNLYKWYKGESNIFGCNFTPGIEIDFYSGCVDFSWLLFTISIYYKKTLYTKLTEAFRWFDNTTEYYDYDLYNNEIVVDTLKEFLKKYGYKNYQLIFDVNTYNSIIIKVVDNNGKDLESKTIKFLNIS